MQFPVLGILGLIFITLKLTEVIAWSWLWVLAPFWIPLAFMLVMFLFVLVVSLLGLSAAAPKRNFGFK